MNKPNIKTLVYIDNKTKRESFQKLKDKDVLIPINFYLHKNGGTLYFELVEKEEENE